MGIFRGRGKDRSPIEIAENDPVVLSLDQALMEMNGSLVEATDEKEEVV